MDSFEKLYDYIWNGQSENIKSLVKKYPKLDVNATSHDGNTLLHWAVYHKKHGICEILINLGANVNAYGNGERNTPLHWAAHSGYNKICELLIKLGSNVNAPNRDSDTPLYKAAYSGHDKTCELLIKLGADVNISNYRGESPLYWASLWNDHKTCEVLIKLGSKINAKIFRKIHKKNKELVLLYENELLYGNEVGSELTELTSKIKKRQEEKKKLLNNFFFPDLSHFILKF